LQSINNLAIFVVSVPSADKKSVLTASFKERVQMYILEHLSDSRLNISQIVTHFDMSRTVFYETFRQEMNTSPVVYIRALRLETAAKMLHETPLLVSEIAKEVGIEGKAYFTKRFHEYHGKTPSDYRKEKNQFRH
jgi:AraC-like DNA-binding protein